MKDAPLLKRAAWRSTDRYSVDIYESLSKPSLLDGTFAFEEEDSLLDLGCDFQMVVVLLGKKNVASDPAHIMALTSCARRLCL